MWPLRRALAVKTWGAQIAIAAATAAVATVAGLVEGHAPSPHAVLLLAAPVAAYVGAAWALSAWRAEGADVALASAGVRGAWAVGWIALLSSPALLLAEAPSAHAAPWRIETAPGALRLHTPTRTVALEWDAAGARRDDNGSRFAGLPAPTRHSAAPPSRARWPRQILRLALLAALLGGLAWRGWRPGVGPTLVAATLACALADLSTALI